MSQVPASLHPKEDDILKLLACQSHIGTKNLDPFNESYIWKRRNDGIYLINLAKTWEKLMLAARIIVAIENPKDVVVISARPLSTRAVLKYARYTGAQAIAGRFTPGTFTNQIQKAFKEPRLLIVTDPRTDHQAITEASYINIPVIAFAHTDSPLKHVDVAIPCNNKGKHAIGLMYWLLAREVLRMRDAIARTQPWDIMVDMFFYRDADEQEKEESAAAAAHADSFQRNMFEGAAPALDAAAAAPVAEGAATAAAGADWAAAGPEGSWDAAAATSDWAGSAQGGEWAAAAPAPAAAAAPVAAVPTAGETWDSGVVATNWDTPQ